MPKGSYERIRILSKPFELNGANVEQLLSKKNKFQRKRISGSWEKCEYVSGKRELRWITEPIERRRLAERTAQDPLQMYWSGREGRKS